MPAVGATEEILTVPTKFAPPVTLVGLITRDESVGALTARVAEAKLKPSFALIAAVAFDATGVVPTVKLALVAPEATVTEEPTVAATLDEESNTTVPVAPAFLEIVTVPVTDVPPTTLATDKCTVLTV